jgi:hypothetical protein
MHNRLSPTGDIVLLRHPARPLIVRCDTVVAHEVYSVRSEALVVRNGMTLAASQRMGERDRRTRARATQRDEVRMTVLVSHRCSSVGPAKSLENAPRMVRNTAAAIDAMAYTRRTLKMRQAPVPESTEALSEGGHHAV